MNLEIATSLVDPKCQILVQTLINCAKDWIDSKPLSKFVSCEISKIIRNYSTHTYIKFSGANDGKDFEFIYYFQHQSVDYKILYDINCGIEYYDTCQNSKIESFNSYKELTNSLIKIIKESKNDK